MRLIGLGFAENGIDVRDESRMEANMFGRTPPALATSRCKQGAQKCSSCRFESPFREDPALRSVPNVKRNAQRSVVRSIAWLGLYEFIRGRAATI
jgi:hypothetical protein